MNRVRDDARQPGAAEPLRRAQTVPARLAIGPIGLGKAAGRTHDAVLKPAALLIAHLIERLPFAGQEGARPFQDLAREIRIQIGEAVDIAARLNAKHLVQQELVVVDRRRVDGHGTFRFSKRGKRWIVASPSRPRSIWGASSS